MIRNNGITNQMVMPMMVSVSRWFEEWMQGGHSALSGTCWGVNYVSSGYCEIPLWNAKVGDTISLKFTLDDLDGTKYLFGGTEFAAAHAYVSSNFVRFSDRVGTVKLDGVEIPNNATAFVEANKEYTLEFTFIADSNVQFIGTRFDLNFRFKGTIKDILMTSETGGNRSYPAILVQDGQPSTLVLKDELSEYHGDDWTVGYGGQGHIAIPKWILPSDFTVSFKLDYTGVIDYQTIVAGAIGNNSCFVVDVVGDLGLRVFYYNKTSNATLLTTPITVGKKDIKVTYSKGKVKIFIDNALVNSATWGDITYCDISMFGRRPPPATVNQLKDRIWDIHLTDNTNPSNSRYYPSIIKSDVEPTTDWLEDELSETGTDVWTPSYKDNGYVLIPPISHFNFEFTASFEEGQSVPIGAWDTGVGGNWYLARDTDGRIRHSLVKNLTVDGKPFSSVTTEVGKEYLFKGSTIGILSSIGGYNNNHYAWKMKGVVRDIKLTKQDGSDSRHYPSLITSETQPNTNVLENVLDEVSGDKWTPDYDGKGHVEIPKWYAKSFELKFSVNVKKFTRQQGILSFGNLGLNTCLHAVLRNNKLFFSTYNAATDFEVPFDFQIGCEYSVILKHEDGKKKAYVDGVFVGEKDDVVGWLDSIGDCTIGNYATSKFNGKIWDIKLTDNTNPSNSRYYPSVITSDSNPDSLVLEDTLNGQNGTLTGFTPSRVIEDFTKPSKRISKAANGIWQSLGTTHGELKNFTIGSEWGVLPSTHGKLVGFDSSKVLGYKRTLVEEVTPVNVKGYKPFDHIETRYVMRPQYAKASSKWVNDLGNDGTLKEFEVGKEWKLIEGCGGGGGITPETVPDGAIWASLDKVVTRDAQGTYILRD